MLNLSTSSQRRVTPPSSPVPRGTPSSPGSASSSQALPRPSRLPKPLEKSLAQETWYTVPNGLFGERDGHIRSDHKYRAHKQRVLGDFRERAQNRSRKQKESWQQRQKKHTAWRNGINLKPFYPKWNEGKAAELQPLLLLGPTPPPPPESQLCCTLLTIAVIPTLFVILAIGSQYDLLAIATACLAPVVAITAFLVTPISPPDDPDEPPPPTFTSVAPCLAATFGFVRASVACLLSPLVMAVTWANVCLSERGISLERRIATSIQLSMGATASMQIWRLITSQTTNMCVVMSAVITLFVALPDSCAWLVVKQRAVAAAMAWLNKQRLYAEESSVAAVETEIIPALNQCCFADGYTQRRQDFARPSRILRRWSIVEYASQRRGRQAKRRTMLYAREMMGLFDDVGYWTRQSPLKTLVVLLNVVVLSAAINIPIDVRWMMELIPNSTQLAVDGLEPTSWGMDQWLALASVLLTAASTSDFVRKHVRPDEYLAGLERELASRMRRQRRASAQQSLWRAIALPVLDVDVIEGWQALRVAELAEVDGMLVDSAEDHFTHAHVAQTLSQSVATERVARAAAELEEVSSGLPVDMKSGSDDAKRASLKIDSDLFQFIIEEAIDAGVGMDLVDVSVRKLQCAARLQRRRQQALDRLELAALDTLELPVELGDSDGTSDGSLVDEYMGLSIDVQELEAALTAAREAFVDPDVIERAKQKLEKVQSAQRQHSPPARPTAVPPLLPPLTCFPEASPNSSPSSSHKRSTSPKRISPKLQVIMKVMATSRLFKAQREASASLRKLRKQRISVIIEDAARELAGALAEARRAGLPRDDDVMVSAEALHAATLHAIDLRDFGRQRLEQVVGQARTVLEPTKIVQTTQRELYDISSQLQAAADEAVEALVDNQREREARELHHRTKLRHDMRHQASYHLDCAVEALLVAPEKQLCDLHSVVVTQARAAAEAAASALVEEDIVLKARRIIERTILGALFETERRALRDAIHDFPFTKDVRVLGSCVVMLERTAALADETLAALEDAGSTRQQLSLDSGRRLLTEAKAILELYAQAQAQLTQATQAAKAAKEELIFKEDPERFAGLAEKLGELEAAEKEGRKAGLSNAELKPAWVVLNDVRAFFRWRVPPHQPFAPEGCTTATTFIGPYDGSKGRE